MAGKSPRGDASKKAPQKSLKDKRAEKRDRAEAEVFKPRKGR
jgi:hypothetical protein